MDSIEIDYTRLRQLRRRAGLRMRDVEQRTGYQRSRIYKVEGGFARPSADVLVRLLELYGGTHRDLVVRVNETPN